MELSFFLHRKRSRSQYEITALNATTLDIWRNEKRERARGNMITEEIQFLLAIKPFREM